MSYERGDVPPGASEWKAPSMEKSTPTQGEEAQEENSEQKFFREKEERLLEADIKEHERIDVSGQIHFKRAGEKLWEDKQIFSKDFLQQHRGEFGTNNSVICFIDKSGHPWVTFDTAFNRRALERAGYNTGRGDILVPFSNGEELNKHDGSARQWEGMENSWREEIKEEERLRDKPGAKTNHEQVADYRWEEIQKKKEQKK